MRGYVHFSIHLWDPTWHRTLQALCILIQCLWIHTHFNPVKGLWFLRVLHSLLFLLSLASFLEDSLNPKFENSMKTSHLGLIVSRSVILCTFSGCIWVSVLVLICFMKKLLWLWLNKAQIFVCDWRSLGILFVMLFF